MKKHVAFFIITGLAVGLFFNNCSTEHMTTEQASVVQEINFLPCSFKSEQELYTETYWAFVRKNCSSCHTERGEGKGAFASSKPDVAYNAFSVVGYEMISDYAVGRGHNRPPYTTPDHEPDILILGDQWIKGLQNIEACKSGSGGVDPTPVDEDLRIETYGKGINAFTGPVNNGTITLTWNLPDDLQDREGAVTLPQIPGSTLTIKVRRILLGAKPAYEIFEPTVSIPQSANFDIKIRSLLVKLNGRLIKNQTTFRYVDEEVRRGENHRLAPGSMLVDGALSEYDVIGLSIGSLTRETLEPLPPKPTISFAQSEIVVNETIVAGQTTSDMNVVRVDVTLSEPYPQYVTATVAVITTAAPQGTALLKPRCCMTIRNDADDNIQVNNWDWDYSLDSLAVVFEPGQVTKTIAIKLSNDQRYENLPEILRLRFNTVINAKTEAVGQLVKITVNDDDANITDERIITFSKLMATNGGVLRNYCLKCHNSVDNRGGYNLSDYDLMIENGVLIPGSAASMMFRRMDSIIPGLRPMPLTGLLSSEERRKVESWILRGAKND